ncbi:MAG: alpha/beta hydrolase [Bdellovibrio sp. CG10_big_fil_rev_8_21_14_0_10_47_8]|nr:MAG: alpha/beta hydrolase [Bdellovibrio sp. CG10_big_fil_rev_8_21_14_0_10_47_8]
MVEAKIAFREVGQGPLLILLHGYAGTVLHWDTVVQKLKSNFRVVVPNLTHLYMSRQPLTFSEQIEVFAGFLRENFLQDGEECPQIHLAGMSYGAALLWGVALKYPALVSKTILINPMPPDPIPLFQIPVLRSIFRLPLNPRSIYLILRTPLGRFFLKRAAQVFRIERADHWDRLDGLHGRKLLFVCHVIERFAFILKSENWAAWKMRLEAWTHPALMIYDHADPLFQEKTYSRFQELIGCKETQELQNAGHIATHTCGAEIAEMIKDYLDVKAGTTAA